MATCAFCELRTVIIRKLSVSHNSMEEIKSVVVIVAVVIHNDSVREYNMGTQVGT